MKRLSKLFLLLLTLSLPVALWAAMGMSMGMSGTWEGLISGNHCALMNMACPASHVKEEIPIFAVAEKGKGHYNFSHFYYMAGLPKDKQSALFGKEVRVKGTLYRNVSTILVDRVEVKNAGHWKPFWSMPAGM